MQFLYNVTQLLATYQYVTVIALDFSKAFNTVRHNTLLEKMADLDMPDEVYNWLASYLVAICTAQDTVHQHQPFIKYLLEQFRAVALVQPAMS